MHDSNNEPPFFKTLKQQIVFFILTANCLVIFWYLLFISSTFMGLQGDTLYLGIGIGTGVSAIIGNIRGFCMKKVISRRIFLDMFTGNKEKDIQKVKEILTSRNKEKEKK